jgi:hypothetical protein
MSVTIEFYSADPNELVRALESAPDCDVSEPLAFEALEALPSADFSLHLRIPLDLDALCGAMTAEGLDAPATFREYLVKQVWCDDPERPSASVTEVSDWLAQGWRVPATLSLSV